MAYYKRKAEPDIEAVRYAGQPVKALPTWAQRLGVEPAIGSYFCKNLKTREAFVMSSPDFKRMYEKVDGWM